MSAPGQVNPSARRGPRLRAWPRIVSTLDARALLVHSRRVGRPSAPAWGAVGIVAAFIAVTCWWLTQDRSIPVFDAGVHLHTAFEYHKMIAAGKLLEPFTQESIYPILGGVVGALATFIGGVNVASPIIGENLVFVPLLALGCYRAGRHLFGDIAGMFAVVFVLGSPLLIAQFHVFMLDAPLTALVAVSIWLILASDHFSRRGMSGLAGLAVGLGVNMKSQFPLFLVGLIVIVIGCGGWRNLRGLCVFCAVAVVVGAPWYAIHFAELGRLLELGGNGSGAVPGNLPPTLSTDNLLWYFWSVLNSQLLAPLFILAVGGAVWMLIGLVRSGGRPVAQLELLGGAVAAWMAITLTPHHDIRYGMPLLAYTAVIGTGWITHVPRMARLGAIALLAIGVGANTLGINFGVGQEVKVALARALPSTQQLPDRVVLYATAGFLVAAPQRDGDIPGLLDALHREGVRTVVWSLAQSEQPDFSFEGLLPLALIAELEPVISRGLEYSGSANAVTLVHEPVTARTTQPCARLSDGTGVWVVRYDAAAGKLAFDCPTRRPGF